MSVVLALILASAAGYLLGSANSSLIVGRFYKIDIRQHGSGNAGLTNMLRTVGKRAALMVLAGDVLKGVLSCLAGFYIVRAAGANGEIGILFGGTAAVLGHNWPVYFGFRGGKGALTSIAVVFMMDWRIALIIIGVFAATVALTRYVSLGSILGAVVFPAAAVLLGKSNVFIIFSAALGLLAIIRHHENIRRLLKGAEPKLGAKKAV